MPTCSIGIGVLYLQPVLNPKSYDGGIGVCQVALQKRCVSSSRHANTYRVDCSVK